MKMPEVLAGLPVSSRYAVIGAVFLGGSGFVVGLIVHAPTSWAAAFEIGLPSIVIGLVLGLVTGSVVTLRRRA